MLAVAVQEDAVKKKSQIALALGDKVIYAFTQALRRVVRPTLTSLPEPHYKQDLSANPKRTAKLRLYRYHQTCRCSNLRSTFFRLQMPLPIGTYGIYEISENISSRPAL